MKKAIDRFLDYISYDTQSDENSTTTPSTEKQKCLANRLAQELKALGIEDIHMTDHAYVIAKLPATAGYENAVAVGFLAHMDTSPAASGANIKPQIHNHWDGKPIPLGNSGVVLTPAPDALGKTIVTTDGTTLLGADDKAGITAIVCALEQIIANKLPHGPISIAFTTDEEIGGDIASLDLKKFGAKYAYTVDGSTIDAYSVRNFNAAGAELTFHGKSEHPGSAWHSMRNALKIAMEFQMSLPQDDVPEESRDTQGFLHLQSGGGDVTEAKLSYLIRAFDIEGFEARKVRMQQITEKINEKYGAGTAEINIHDSYKNMYEIIEKHPVVSETLHTAIRDVIGREPREGMTRGGTDGARLSFLGLPCPNFGAGGRNFHGISEYLIVEEMEQSIQVILNIVRRFAKKY